MTTSLVDLVFVVAGSYLLFSPKLNVSNLILADVLSGCVYLKKKIKNYFFVLFLTSLVCF